MKEYNEVVKQLFPLGNVYGIRNINVVDDYLGDQLHLIPYIHVGGTNGKGSVTHKLTQAYLHSGYKVGCFTSPHLYSVRERIKIGNDLISKEDFIRLFEEVLSIYKKLNLEATYFECLTVMGFLYFKEQKVDLAVIEVGLGGKLDATNIISPMASIITSVQKDHENILGSSLEQIAYQKAGIIKKNTPIILSPTAQKECVLDYANRLDAPIIRIKEQKSVSDLHKQLVIETIKAVPQFPVDLAILDQITSFKPKCRFEKADIKGPKAVIFDVAHNLKAFRNLYHQLQQEYPEAKYRYVLGVGEYKDIKGIFAFLQKHAEGIHVIDCEHPKLIKKENLAQNFSSLATVASTQNTIKQAHELASQNQEILIFTGSFYIFPKVNQYFNLQVEMDDLSIAQTVTMPTAN